MHSDTAFGVSFGAYSVSINGQRRRYIQSIDNLLSVVHVVGDWTHWIHGRLCREHFVGGEKRDFVDHQRSGDNVDSNGLYKMKQEINREISGQNGMVSKLNWNSRRWRDAIQCGISC